MSENDVLEPTPEEAAAAEALRKALDENGPNEDADFLRSLQAANAPAALDARVNDEIIERALGKKAKPKRGVVIRVTFGAAAVLAVAASIFLVLGKLAPDARPPAPLARVRSTQPLFDKPFDKETSARVDRIAMARASDLRENRFAQWGVR
jgi:hypothetical protein